MAIERKCPACSYWNNEEDYCVSCGTVLSPAIIVAQREERLEQERLNAPKPFIDRFLESWEHSRFLLIRISFHIFYTIWAIVMSIAFFFAYITIGVNG